MRSDCDLSSDITQAAAPCDGFGTSARRRPGIVCVATELPPCWVIWPRPTNVTIFPLVPSPVVNLIAPLRAEPAVCGVNVISTFTVPLGWTVVGLEGVATNAYAPAGAM